MFGDTGGHAPQLFAALRSIGIEPRDGIIPEGVRVIHCGDLIHKGEHSKVLLAVVDTLIRNNPGQWIQILGNHEFQHIEGSPSFWRCACDLEDVGIINDWFDEGLATASFADNSVTSIELSVKPRQPINLDNGIFFSHAGLTRKWWDTFFQGKTLEEGSQALNEQDVWVITQPGEMLTGRRNLQAGPVWATGNNEVFNSWVHPDDDRLKTMDFVQVHGHTTSFIWATKRWWNRTDLPFREFKAGSKIDSQARAVITSMAGGTLIGIDPGYAKYADTIKQPYISFES